MHADLNSYLDKWIILTENVESTDATVLERKRNETFYHQKIEHLPSHKSDSSFQSPKIETILSIMNQNLDKFNSVPIGEEESRKLKILKELVKAKVQDYHQLKSKQNIIGRISHAISGLLYEEVNQLSEQVLNKIDDLLQKEKDISKKEKIEGEEVASRYDESMHKSSEDRHQLHLEIFKRIVENGEINLIPFLLKYYKLERSEVIPILKSSSKITAETVAQIAREVGDQQLLVDFDTRELEKSLEKAAQTGGLSSIISILKQNRIARSRVIEILASRCSSEQIIKIAKTIGDKQLLKDCVLFFHGKITRGPNDADFSDLTNPQLVNKIDTLLAEGYPITTQTLDQAFYSNNYACINLILKYASKEWLEQNAQHILKRMMELEEPTVGNLLFQHFPQILSRVDLFPILSEAVAKRHGWFVEWALANGGQIKTDAIEQLMPTALESCNLRMIKSLCQSLKPQTDLTIKFQYPQILGLEEIKDKNQLLEKVASFAINSPLADLYELVALYPQIGTVLSEALEIASLLVRFPNARWAREVNVKFENSADYIQNSIEYAQENRKFIRLILPKLSSLSRDQLLNEIIADRYGRMKQPNESYKTKQIDQPAPTYTPLKHVTLNDIYPMTYRTTTGLNRYGWSIRHFINLGFNWAKQTWEYPPYSSMQPTFKGIQFSYSFKTSQGQLQEFPLTVLDKYMSHWSHTDEATIQALQQHLEDLHREILDFPLASSNQEEFFEKVAMGYWLIATLCETWRGTPHNAMIWLNLVYEHHHLPPPIPKIEHFFLDNTMLMIPFEKAVKDWHSFFEPTLDQALAKMPNSREQIKNLLKQNGLLLRLCSDNIRNDKELASIAVSQNPEAIQYVSPNLRKDMKTTA
jgi:hypothetical protein